MANVTSEGSFKNIEKLISNITSGNYMKKAEAMGEVGVMALAQATPKDSGKTAESWGYEIIKNRGGTTVYWNNSNVNDGVNIALILQTGHGTGTGGYVPGNDYINPTIQPIFDKTAEAVWKEVTK